MMFGRLLLQLLRGNRGRLAVALIAIVSGAAVISALLNLDFDVDRKLTQEFRLLGANLIVASRRTGGTADSASSVPSAASPSSAPTLIDQAEVLAGINRAGARNVVAVAPFVYIVARVAKHPVVVAGTWLDQMRPLEPTWRIDGDWVASSDDTAHGLVGRNVARQLNLAPGSRLDLTYVDRTATITVAGILDSGGTEDNQVFVNLPVAQNLSGLTGKIELVQLSVNGSSARVADDAARLTAALPGCDVRPIRQVAEAEGQLLNRTRLLIVSMILLILTLTALCVLGTMAALAEERREDVGLMKALGGSIFRIMVLFFSEVGVLGAVGGFIGCLVGLLLSVWMGQRVFGTSITLRWQIFPLTIGLMVLVAMAGVLPLQWLGKVKPAVILRGE
jgi:putative ABC transport system permease protein